MEVLPAIATVRDMRINPNDVFKAAKERPVMVMSRSETRAVVISPEHWDSIARRLQRAEVVSKVYAARARRAKGEEQTYTFDEVIAGIRERHGNDVADRILERGE